AGKHFWARGFCAISTFGVADVKELSIQTLKKGEKRQAKKIPIVIHTGASLTFS
ncbi:hypothetical protein MNBD_NITROSPINAE02-349, partial [hydrothermal vent metagenome]